jgi:opacity protein-like surface antigen
MKTIAVPTFAALLALVAPVQAGVPAMEVEPAPATDLWEWFAGGSVGYLTDLEEAMYSLQFGVETRPMDGRGAHALFLQVGFTQDDATFRVVPPPGKVGGRTETAAIDLNIIPITLNYQYGANLTGGLDCYFGLGVGIAILDSSSDWRWTQALPPPNGQRGGSYDETDVRFYGEIMAGLSYGFSDAFEMFLGARYMLMDNADLRVNITGTPLYEAGIDGDLLIEMGARYRF